MGSMSPEAMAFADAGIAQQSFASRFDLDNPAQAMSAYTRAMHEHTKQQFHMATTSARRRSQGGLASSLPSDTSSLSSVSSAGS